MSTVNTFYPIQISVKTIFDPLERKKREKKVELLSTWMEGKMKQIISNRLGLYYVEYDE